MSGDVFAVTSGKGGVGKTTTTVNLAIALRQRGHSVAVVDADLGMPNVAAFLSSDVETTLHDVLAGDATTAEAITEIGEGLGFCFGEQSLDGFAEADPTRLDEVIEELADRYQYVLVDTGGGLTYEGAYPMELADQVLLVTSPIPAAITDTKKSKQLADRLGVPVRGVIVTHTDDDTDSESIADELGVEFLGGVPTDDAVTESATARKPLVAYAPESAATVAYYRLAEMLSDPASAELDPLDSARKPSSGESAEPPSKSESEDSEDSPVESDTTSTKADEEPASTKADEEPASTKADEGQASTVSTEDIDRSTGDNAATNDESTAESESTTGEESTAEGEPSAENGGRSTENNADAASEANTKPGLFRRILGRFR